MPDGLRSSTRSPNIRALRKLDGLDSGDEADPWGVDQGTTTDGADELVEEGGDVVEDEKEENDVDPETQRNTQANESMTPRSRLLRRRASSKMNASLAHSPPDSDPSHQSPPKHVEFADEDQPVRVLERHRKALHDPRTPGKRREHARELLEFHGEDCD